MLFYSAPTTPSLAGKVDELTTLLKNAQNLVVVLTALLITGGTGILAAWQKIRRQVKTVEEQVEPIKHEVTDSASNVDGPTLRGQVDEIRAQVQELQKAQPNMHADNTDRLDSIERSVAAVKDELKELKAAQDGQTDDIREVRQLVQRVLSKMAGV
jgi:predicted  nucleic acid-binding Zn-ribbon protein